VVGDDAWQMAFLEAGADRILILSGAFEESVDAEVGRLLSTLRQHVDVVVGTETGLRNVSASGILGSALWVQLDAPPNQSDTPGYRALRHHLSISLDGGQLALERIPQNEWSTAGGEVASWWMRLDTAGLTIAIAPDLETAARVAPVTTALVVAPGGDAETFLRTLPGVAVATNGYRWDNVSEQSVRVPTHLIRTFPRDLARFRFEEDRLLLPSWSQELLPRNQGS
jgi:hypothetical protein